MGLWSRLSGLNEGQGPTGHILFEEERLESQLAAPGHEPEDTPHQPGLPQEEPAVLRPENVAGRLHPWGGWLKAVLAWMKAGRVKGPIWAGFTKNSRSRAQVNPGAVEPVYIQVEVEKGRLQYWQVSQDELHALDEQDLVPGIRIICFTRQDHRFLVDRPLSTQKAKSMAYRELVSLEPVRVVNLSRKYGVVYATHVGRLSRFPARLVPGVACLDMKVGPVKKACAVGIELGSMDGVHLVMVYALKPGVSEAEWVVSINPPHREEIYRTWKARHKLQQQTILDAVALIEQAQALPAYPGQPEWNGLDLKQVERAGRWSLAGLSAMMVIWAAASWFELHSALQANQDLGQSIHTEQVRLGALIERYPKVFAWQASLKEDIIFHEAQAVWRPGTTVSIRADLQSVRLRVELPLIGSRDNRMNRFGIFSVTGLHRLLPVLEESPPEGCDALGMLVSGDMNEIEQDFNCPYRGSSFGALVHG